jgi:hypothetical protein
MWQFAVGGGEQWPSYRKVKKTLFVTFVYGRNGLNFVLEI